MIGRTVTRRGFEGALTWRPGLFHAGAIIALADERATAAAMWEPKPPGECRPELFPLTLRMSAHVIRNADRGTLVPEAEIIRRGRTTLIGDARSSHDRERLIATFVVTPRTPASPAVTTPVDARSR
jgi:acyl-coenzyme A thioesterase PaaI-like protein